MQISGILADAPVVFPSTATTAGGGCKLPYEFNHFRSFSDSTKSLFSPAFPTGYLSFSVRKLKIGQDRSQTRRLKVRASANSGGDSVPFAPLQLESPIGQFLEQTLQTNPHLLLAAIDQQLENLQNEKDEQKKEKLPPSQDLLYKRIAEVKEKERRKALVEILYSIVVHKFIDKDISMIPKISATSDPTGRVDFWPNQEQKLESVHSPEAFEMIVSHLSLVLGERAVGPFDNIVQISKIKLGKLYAASIMYGYFLKRVDQRYQLERSMNTLPEGFLGSQPRPEQPAPNQLWDPDSLIVIEPEDVDTEGLMGSVTDGSKSYRLRSYVMYLDAETLQRYATLRSKEALSVIEKQTQALFGRPDIKVSEDGTLDVSNDEEVSLSYSGLTMLVLEAVALGSFLWEAESYVESKYHFLNS
nr:UV-B-induced protein At3g17800, chloroplastic [Ipomoea batatas]GMC52105.1 UV-B-induced protein At3g17800, chloroplastic [Ipomoea batatas]